MKANLKKIRQELMKRCKAGPPSDYQDLWKTLHDLLKDFEAEIREIREFYHRFELRDPDDWAAQEIVSICDKILGEEVSIDG